MSCFNIYDFEDVSKQNSCIQKCDVSGSCPSLKSFAVTRGSGSAIMLFFVARSQTDSSLLFAEINT